MTTDVVALGALCDRDESEIRLGGESANTVSFRVLEFADLSDGRRVVIHQNERGFSSTLFNAEGRRFIHSRDQLISSVLTVVLPDGDSDSEDHPWQWLADRLDALGVKTSPEKLRSVPYRVEFGEGLNNNLE